MSKTHFKKLQNPNYLGSWDLMDDSGAYNSVTATIKAVRKETVFDGRGNSEELPVVHFSDMPRPMILNSTNIKAVAQITGTPFIEEWVGAKIGLQVQQVKAFGDVTDALRVFMPKKAAPKTPAKPMLTKSMPAWAQVAAAVAAGKVTTKSGDVIDFTLEHARAKYTIDNESEFLADVKELQA